MRVGYVRLVVEYAVDLDNPLQVENAMDFVCEDIYNAVKFNELEGYIETVEDSSLTEDDIHIGILELSGDLVDRFKICPRCGHDWIAHFGMIDTSRDPKGELVDPYPATCMECGTCDYALELSEE